MIINKNLNKKFTRIVIDTIASIDIIQNTEYGNNCSIIKSSNNQDLKITEQGSTLFITSNSNNNISGNSIISNGNNIIIGMNNYINGVLQQETKPKETKSQKEQEEAIYVYDLSLSSIEMNGAASIKKLKTNQVSKDLSISLNGVTSIKIEDYKFETLSLNLSGTTKINLKDIKVSNLYANISGTSNLKISDSQFTSVNLNLSGISKCTCENTTTINLNKSISGMAKLNGLEKTNENKNEKTNENQDKVMDEVFANMEKTMDNIFNGVDSIFKNMDKIFTPNTDSDKKGASDKRAEKSDNVKRDNVKSDNNTQTVKQEEIDKIDEKIKEKIKEYNLLIEALKSIKVEEAIYSNYVKYISNIINEYKTNFHILKLDPNTLKGVNDSIIKQISDVIEDLNIIKLEKISEAANKVKDGEKFYNIKFKK